MAIRTILKQIWAGERLGRAMMNAQIWESVTLNGLVIDLGGRGHPTYLAELDRSPVTTFLTLDLQVDESIDVGGEVTYLPFGTGSCDTLLCFNVLEHVYEYQMALDEMRRVLKPGGTLYLRVPFLMNVHADPADYWRYTAETLVRILQTAGFTGVCVQPQGGLIVALFSLLEPVWERVGILQGPLGMIALFADQLLSRFIGDKNQAKYPRGYLVTAR